MIKKIYKKDKSLETIYINPKPISLEQFAELFNLVLILTETSDKTWITHFSTHSSVAAGSGKTQLQALADLTEKLKGKSFCYYNTNIKIPEELIHLGHRGYIKRK